VKHCAFRVLAIGIAAALCGCATPTPSQQREGTVVSTEADGIRVILSLDKETLPAGEPLHATVAIANIGLDTAFWDSSCGLVAVLTLKGPDMKPQDPGKDWAGLSALIKLSAIGNGPRRTGFVPPNVPAGTRVGCNFSGSDEKELAPGAVDRADAVWYGRTSDLLPAPAGSYAIGATLLFRGRAGRGGPTSDSVPISVRTTVVVTGDDFRGLSAAAALDAALADPMVAKWVDTNLTGNQSSGASMQFGDDRMWHLTIDRQDPATTQIVSSGIVVVDPNSGRVVSRDLPG
jgi:hypothetical protein